MKGKGVVMRLTVLGELAKPIEGIEDIDKKSKSKRAVIIDELHTLSPLSSCPIHIIVVFLAEKYGGPMQLWYYALLQLFNRSMPIDTRLRDFRKQLVHSMPSIVRLGDTHNG